MLMCNDNYQQHYTAVVNTIRELERLRVLNARRRGRRLSFGGPGLTGWADLFLPAFSATVPRPTAIGAAVTAFRRPVTDRIISY